MYFAPEPVSVHLSRFPFEVFLPHLWRWSTGFLLDFRRCKARFQIVEVDYLPLTTLSRLPPLLQNAIGNIRQFHNLPRTTTRFEEFLSSFPQSVSIPNSVSYYREPLTLALCVVISFLRFLRPLEVLSQYLLCLRSSCCCLC